MNAHDTDRDDSAPARIASLLEKSSFGAPAARAIRARTPLSRARRIAGLAPAVAANPEDPHTTPRDDADMCTMRAGRQSTYAPAGETARPPTNPRPSWLVFSEPSPIADEFAGDFCQDFVWRLRMLTKPEGDLGQTRRLLSRWPSEVWTRASRVWRPDINDIGTVEHNTTQAVVFVAQPTSWGALWSSNPMPDGQRRTSRSYAESLARVLQVIAASENFVATTLNSAESGGGSPQNLLRYVASPRGPTDYAQLDNVFEDSNQSAHNVYARGCPDGASRWQATGQCVVHVHFSVPQTIAPQQTMFGDAGLPQLASGTIAQCRPYQRVPHELLPDGVTHVVHLAIRYVHQSGEHTWLSAQLRVMRDPRLPGREASRLFTIADVIPIRGRLAECARYTTDPLRELLLDCTDTDVVIRHESAVSICDSESAVVNSAENTVTTRFPWE